MLCVKLEWIVSFELLLTTMLPIRLRKPTHFGRGKGNRGVLQHGMRRKRNVSVFSQHNIYMLLFLVFFPSQACGGANRLSVYSTTETVQVLPVPVAQNTSLPGSWKYQGCLKYVNFLICIRLSLMIAQGNKRCPGVP